MKMYAYCILDSNKKIKNNIRGLNEALVYSIPFRDIGIAVSDFNEQVQVTNENVLKHEEVVEKLMEDFNVLPMRFNTCFGKNDEVISVIKLYYPDFIRNFDELKNKLEFSVKAIWNGKKLFESISRKYNDNSTIQMPGKSPGISYMNKKLKIHKAEKEFEEKAEIYINAIDNSFSRLICEKKLIKLISRDLLLKAYYLVENEKRLAFKQKFEQVKSSQPDLKFLFSGPWPPYNFISLRPPKKQNLVDGKISISGR
ncbi:MAG: GvpL/GvpF family gas vesicle protein [Ignavibacteria bacterium]|jgi:hypothetical protein